MTEFVLGRLMSLAIVPFLVAGCSLTAEPLGEATNATVQADLPALKRIRKGQILNWQAVEDGLIIELATPRRKYQLTLEPTCHFALSRALGFEIEGASQDFIGINDDIVVGAMRCRIVAIEPSSRAFEPRASLQTDVPISHH